MVEDQQQSHQQQQKKDPIANDPTTPSTIFYYYQNPLTGTVSNAPLSVDQLIKLLVPVREGMAPILPSHSQCLAVHPTIPVATTTTTTTTDANYPAEVIRPSFGEWKPVSTVNVLKEAACTQWYLSGGEGGKDPRGPMTCRTILEAYNQEETSNRSKLLVYAQNITTAWTVIDQLPALKQVLQALQPVPVPAPPPPTATTTATIDSAGATAETNTPENARNTQEVQDELEAFLSSTAAAGDDDIDDDDDDDDHACESDGGTRYVKDPLSGRWIHEALAPPKDESNDTKQQPSSKADSSSNGAKKTSHKKAKFAKRNARNWIYITGLPNKTEHVDVQELQKFFGKVGMLDLDPETLEPKIKLYRDGNGILKGDASLCYARPESVELALQVLDESPWDEHHTVRVERAKFEAKANDDQNDGTDNGGAKRKKRPVSQAQRKVARLALLQAQDEGFGERLAGGRKGLRIVVVKHMLDGIPEADWESTIQEYCQELDAAVEKITCISRTKVVLLKFVEPTAAAQAVDAWNGKVPKHGNGQPMKALYWDGVTDYTESNKESNPEEEEKRHEDFGKWLDDQGEEDLPPELRLQVAQD